MSENICGEVEACLKLNRWYGVSLQAKLAALEKYSNFESLLKLSISEWQSFSGSSRVSKLPKEISIEQDLQWLSDAGHYFLPKTDNRYPSSLHHLTDPPLGLYVIGNIDALSVLAMAIVGSRKQTSAGKHNAIQFSTQLSQLGIAISSGLAYGIDTSAHIACCDVKGVPIAVAGNGLDIIYPRQNKFLARRIAEQGCIISELPIGMPPKREHFPARNRIISGLSIAVIVVEAAKRSGSLITARLAAEQGKEVFAVPGSILSPQSSGCHHLIRQGAVLMRSIDDVIAELQLPLSQVLQECNDKKRTIVSTCPVLTNMGYEPTSLDTLIRLSGLKFEQLSSKLIELELDGLIKRGHNGHYTRLI